jgi:hypothetical protein
VVGGEEEAVFAKDKEEGEESEEGRGSLTEGGGIKSTGAVEEETEEEGGGFDAVRRAGVRSIFSSLSLRGG